MAMIFIDFRPAEYHNAKCSYVAYYVRNPETDELVRKRIKLNRVQGSRNRAKFAARLCTEINQKLYEGWNPFLENDAFFRGTTLQKGIKDFLASKCPNVRPDTVRSYHSYLKWFNALMQNGGKLQMPIKLFTMHDAGKVMDALAARLDIGAATYNSYLEFFRNLFNHFVTRDWIKENPFSKMPRRRDPDAPAVAAEPLGIGLDDGDGVRTVLLHDL
ncbi:MAG: hypothetical protein MJZ49_04615, partial [Bacteroidales bacterium]|nr:hypothetical protein [Bacteroidales bacterium]